MAPFFSILCSKAGSTFLIAPRFKKKKYKGKEAQVSIVKEVRRGGCKRNPGRRGKVYSHNTSQSRGKLVGRGIVCNFLEGQRNSGHTSGMKRTSAQNGCYQRLCPQGELRLPPASLRDSPRSASEGASIFRDQDYKGIYITTFLNINKRQ